MKRMGRKLLVPATGLVLATGGFAYLGTNTVAASTAGTGAGVISGVNVESVNYIHCNGDEAQSSDPNGFADICYANLRVQAPKGNPIPSDVDARFAGGPASWTHCTRASSDDSDSNYADNSRGFVCNFQSDPQDPSTTHLLVSAVG
jgi:hypothetical protein